MSSVTRYYKQRSPVMLIFALATAAFICLYSTTTGSVETFSMPKVTGQNTIEKNNLTTPIIAKNNPTTHHESDLPSVDSRRRLAAVVAEVQREIRRLAGKKAVIDADWHIRLAAVAEELDPRISLSAVNSWDFSARLPDMNSSSQLSHGTRHVCPEVYFGSGTEPLYSQHGMEHETCSYVPEFNSVLTAVLPVTTWASESINFVIKQIRKYYGIPIIAIVSSTDEIHRNVSSLTIEKVDVNYDEGKYINALSERIKTPYVLIATSLAHFNNQSSLERLVRVLDELEMVKVAGGAARDLEGHWIHGCLQQRMANYQAHYRRGYHYSKYECMYCDDLLTPFITTTAFIRQVAFTNGLGGNVLYRDWFAKVRINGHLTMACPDVMFYVRNHPTMNEEQWLMFAKQWHLERITSYDSNQYSFDCSSVGITCEKPLGIINSFLLPLCCRALMEKYLSYLTDYGKAHNLTYELHVGSALGAMKMDSYLPWDYDMDLNFKCKDFNAWMDLNKVLKPKGCRATISKRNKYITIFCPNFFLELYCKQYDDSSVQFLPAEYQHTPTIIKYSGKDVVITSNPGLHCRNFYGMDDLKHAAHWRTLKLSKLGKAKGGYDSPGLWNPCKKPKHHSCLDHYPGDGNLPFQEPFLQL